ncbi:histone-like nucleoid-structuring protein Lsr2 [Pseudarthrobacter sp. S9]|uniref:histone-like nucleoid-structuring protein Lsr2 n=1 Tax=Pseudarthrobacter sp. S9 TaxID=3418421 RepID=UPI003D014CE3
MNHNQRTPLARKIRVQLIDDLSGENAEETVRFSVDGADYEIDLTADNAAELRAALAKYIANGRRLRGPSASRAGTTAPMSREETRRIRDWATRNGYNPSTRGRIRQDIQQAYAAAHA